MSTENHGITIKTAIEKATLAETMSRMEQTCKDCKPLSMITCVSNCNIWKLKNEFRKLHKKMQNPTFITQLLNTIKNKRRLEILDIITKGQYSTTRLQQELKKLGYNSSQTTITEEYITPLTDVELVTETQNKYYTTLFGCKLNELIKNFRDIGEILPPHSECYEEKILPTLLHGPKTYEELGNTIPAKSIARVLNRLQTAGLVETNKEKDYVFFFKTQRNPNKERFSPTEKKVYENISEQGDPARKLAEKNRISLRRIYKYLRRLKGKKMVFAREKPRTYALTPKGLQMAMILQKMHDLVAETMATATQIVQDEQTVITLAPDAHQVKSEKKRKTTIPLTTVQYIKSD
jgi:predicted transcriptional regulator